MGMRLDPRMTPRARQKDVASMLDEVRRIWYRTALPEQYYLVERMEGWRHLDPSWNMEVGPLYEDPGFTWPRSAARQAATASRGQLWFQQAVSDVNVFHFSGTKLHPWWYADLSPEAAFNEAATEWHNRDPRRLVATAVRGWAIALEQVAAESSEWPSNERRSVETAMRRLRERAVAHRSWVSRRSAKQLRCRRCQNWFTNTQGRWLLGWEGWWLCCDCIVGYIFSDEEPEAPQCWRCSSSDHGSWEWRNGQPWWHCITCRTGGPT